MIALLSLLFLSHALADYVLQTNRIYRFKTRSLWGGVLHASIFAIVAILLTWPLAQSFPVFLLWVFLTTASHVVIDH
ncbi:MAG: DUF3307 domain-containing protein, partial [Candidatus Margulisiibacteriota bacterium]